MANLAKIIDDIATSAKLEKFFSSLKHADLPAGWQTDPDIVDAAGKMYRKMGTNSPFFKAWFGNSEFANAKGKPVPFYHGTNREPFDVFKTGGDGAFFANNRYIARTYGTKNITKAFLKSENPLIISGDKANWSKIDPRADYWIPKTREYGELNQYLPDTDYLYSTKDVPLMARKKDHDSVYFREINDIGPYSPYREGDDDRIADVATVFSPTQIKSATNRGTFDPSDPNILRTSAPWLAGGGIAAGSVLGGGEAQAAPYSHADANNLDRTIERLSKSMPLNDMASGMIPRATQASVQPINNMGAWQQMEQQGRVTPDLPVPEAEWSPVDLATAPIGAAGKVGKLAAMALDAPINLAVNRLIDALSAGANTASNWWNGK
jgi:hypothetical protein